MNNRAAYERALELLFDGYVATGESEGIQAYLQKYSNLPGPRGNLELVASFADAVSRLEGVFGSQLKTLCFDFSEVSAQDAPVNTRAEFIPVCGIVGLGAIAGINDSDLPGILEQLYLVSSDSRWRVREAVAMALQRIIRARGIAILDTIQSWIGTDNWLTMRAVAAGVAEPDLLQDHAVARQALDIHRVILERVLVSRERRNDEFLVLRKGLSYSLSVIIRVVPTEGFSLLQDLVATRDRDILTIVRENVKKNRLIRHYPEQVQDVVDALNAQSTE